MHTTHKIEFEDLKQELNFASLGFQNTLTFQIYTYFKSVI